MNKPLFSSPSLANRPAVFTVLSLVLCAFTISPAAPSSAPSLSAPLLKSPRPTGSPERRATNRADDSLRPESHDLNIKRRRHAALALGYGKVLVLGGENEHGLVRQSEIFDAGSRTFSVAAELISPRTDATVIRLVEGRVLVLGGRNQSPKLRSTELYDESSNSFTSGPKMIHARAGATATLLEGGRVLVIGGDAEGSAEILDPSCKSFSPVGARLNIRRAFHSAIVLKSGRVLIAGGRDPEGSSLASAEIFDPETSTFSPIPLLMGTHRVRPMLRLLPDGKVQVIGGDERHSIEMFNTEGRYFTALVHLSPDSPETISQVLRSETRAALIQRAERDSSYMKKDGTFLPSDGRTSTARSSELLDRDDYTLTDIPESGIALVTGGLDSHGTTLGTMAALESSGATVTTDETDYSPGETVVISGTNWEGGETVRLTLHRDNDTPDTLLSALADADGNISNSDYIVQQSDLDVTFLLTAVGLSSGFTAQTTFTDQSNLITQIGFNAVNQPTSFSVGVSNAASSPLRVQSRNAGGTGEAVTGSGNSITVQVTANSAAGRFDTSSAGSFTATHLTLQIPAGSQNTPDFFYRDTTAGSVTLVATVIATAGVTNLPLNSTGSITKVVNKANTTTSIASSVANPLPCGQSVLFTATVAAATPGGAGAATGTITFKDGATTLGVGTLSAGPPFTATLTTSSLSLAGHSISAVYGGDSNFNGSTSAVLPETVTDDQAPVSTLIGPNPFTVECHTPYSEPGATATDLCAGDLTNAIVKTGSVNPNLVGVYTVRYNVSDPSGNPSVELTRIVTVVDSTPPTISLIGASPVSVECHSTFVDPGATANDICAGELTGSILVNGNVNADVVGTYVVHYEVTDQSGNTVEATRTVNVIDTTPPRICLVGANSFTVECHTTFADPGAVATDLCDITLTASTASGNVDINIPGDYVITYSASDSSNNPATPVTRTVHVVDTTPSVPNLTILPTVTGQCSAAIGSAPVGTDSCAGTITATTADPLTYNTQGTFTVHWTYDDGHGNTSTQIQAVVIEDTIAPIGNAPSLPTVTAQCSATLAPPTATDNCAGVIIAASPDPLTYSTPGTYVVHWVYNDGRGNASNQTQTVIVQDTMAPTITTCGSSRTVSPINGQALVPSFLGEVVATDNCTPSAQLVMTQSPAAGTVIGPGSHAVVITVKDAANNAATCTATFNVSYEFAGFYQPIDNPPVVNIVNSGRAIPIRFTLTGYHGLNIFEPGYPRSAVIACDLGAPAETVDETVAAGGSSLTYDATGDQYIYVWKTEKTWANSCRQLVVKFADGSSRRANFRFLK